MTVSLHVWRVPAAAVPRALWRMARDPGRVRRSGTRFVKLLGTGTGFGPSRPDLTRWAALTVQDGRPPDFPGWARIAAASCRLDLRPLASRGSWRGRQPFEVQDAAEVRGRTDAPDGPVLALTRARLRPSRALSFWRAAGPVGAALAGRDGLLAAFGIGEAPIGWQGTVSVWREPADLVRFAYRHPEHRRAIERTATTGWYAEELFARFAVTGVVGDTGVIGWARQAKERRSG
ncbi:MAG TPA: monooxygenase [Rugosimonospora sp.]|nr:monooxygenase [Rugosimonospora sp.]